MDRKIDDISIKKPYTAESIFSYLLRDLTSEERISFLKKLLTSFENIDLIAQAAKFGDCYMLNLNVEIETTKEFIRMYSLSANYRLKAKNCPNYENLTQKLTNFLADIKSTPKSSQCQILRQEVSDGYGEEVIHCFLQKNDLLAKLENQLTDSREKIKLTTMLVKPVLLSLDLELLNSIKKKIEVKLFDVKKENGKHSVEFFSSRTKPLEKLGILEIDIITDEDMLNSAFGQGSNTVKRFS